MSARRIVHFHPNGRFASQFVDPLVLAELSRGYVSTMVTSINTSAVEGRVIPYDLSLRNLPGLLFAFAKICIFFFREKPDLVVSHNTKSSSLPLFAAWLMGVKSRVYFNHGVPFIAYGGVLRSVLRLMEIINCRLASEIVTVSSDMQDVLLGLKPSAKVSLIANGSACGIDLEMYDASRYADSSFRADHGISKVDMVVVFIGRPEKRKGFELILRLWRDSINDSGIKLILCGPEQSDVLKVLAKVPPNVICMGFVKNIPEVLSNADCLILPSLHEGLSYAVLEAMACGCFVIANDIDGVRDLVLSGHNGYLVKDNSVSDYASLIFALKAPTNDVSDMKLNALKTAKLFSREIFLHDYLSNIERIAGLA